MYSSDHEFGQLTNSPSSFFRHLNLDYVEPNDVPVHAPLFDASDRNAEFCVGMSFPDKASLLWAVKSYCLKKNVDCKAVESKPDKYYGKCTASDSGCKWRLRAILRARSQNWEITKYEGPHNCNAGVLTTDHRQLDSNFICSLILKVVKANPSVSISEIISLVDQSHQYVPSYRKAWIGK